MQACPVCELSVEDLASLSVHLVDEAERSDIAHVMWLNRNVTKQRVGATRIAALLEQRADGVPTGGDRVRR